MQNTPTPALLAAPHTPRTRCLAAWAALALALSSASAAINWYVPNPDYSIARNWNERILEGIRMDTPHPPGQARNLFSFSVCMYDAWAAYDANAVGFVYRGKHTAPDVAAARREAISYAMYRMMLERHAFSRTATNQAVRNPEFMSLLGYDPENVSRDTSTPAGVGNSVYDAVSAYFLEDGSRQSAGTPFPTANPPVAYPDYPVGHPRRYVFVNGMMDPFRSGTMDTNNNNSLLDVNKWQRLIVAGSIDQNGFPQNPLQGYLGAQWLWVRSFSLSRTDENQPWIDPGPPPYLGTDRHQEFLDNLVEVIRASSELTTQDGVMVDISPASIGDNTLGANDGHGYTANPLTGQPYVPNNVLRGDFTRALTEFWADGPTSETPPGHWNSIANHVSDDMTSFRIGGAGPEVNRLEWDVKLYFSLNAAVFDAGCAAWSVKRHYNGWRPISAIRYCGGHGQSSDPTLPSYHTNGLPLVADLIELVTEATVTSGRHAGLTPGKIALLSWPGQPEFPAEQTSGVKWVHAEDWMTYQKKTFVTPGFPGYISGHSTFSRAAAEALTGITGSKWFPHGLGTYTLPALVNEAGPTQPVTLQWASYYDAADQVGLSRIWGGIHPPADDVSGRRVGAQVGQTAWALAQKYFDGTVADSEIHLDSRPLADGNVELRYTAVRGLFYTIHSAANVNGPYSAGDTTKALEASIASTNAPADPQKFFRVSSSLAP
ncbi:MAG: vanadium-dependent haloperoxidase [Verrucomicrobia bacterium]|nr:vanadium-dependent haloperoxidase [Verrucomicrobiota bacterium]